MLRFFTTRTALWAIPKKTKLPPRPTWLIKDEEIKEVFIKGGRGPGGQKINKTNSKVQLTHLPTGKVVTCQYSRSQEKNRKRARELLALWLEEQLDPENCRTAVLAKRERMVKQNRTKKARRKHKREDDEEVEIVEEEDPEKELDRLLEQARSQAWKKESEKGHIN